MALISDAASTWSAPLTLTVDEVWQTRKGSVFVTTTNAPAADDGVALLENSGIRFSAGTQVRYRKADDTVQALIVREAV